MFLEILKTTVFVVVVARTFLLPLFMFSWLSISKWKSSFSAQHSTSEHNTKIPCMSAFVNSALLTPVDIFRKQLKQHPRNPNNNLPSPRVSVSLFLLSVFLAQDKELNNNNNNSKKINAWFQLRDCIDPISIEKHSREHEQLTVIFILCIFQRLGCIVSLGPVSLVSFMRDSFERKLWWIETVNECDTFF